jgi:SWI/SNF-related matrix-associated actin-dependent regulator 1 of chromatin subfamily A
VEPYYGDQKTRAELRYSLENRKDEFHVIVTTYKLATGAKEDRIFLKKAFNFDVPLPNTPNDVNNRSVFSTKATCSRTA